jgi:hypothetical protein
MALEMAKPSTTKCRQSSYQFTHTLAVATGCAFQACNFDFATLFVGPSAFYLIGSDEVKTKFLI